MGLWRLGVGVKPRAEVAPGGWGILYEHWEPGRAEGMRPTKVTGATGPTPQAGGQERWLCADGPSSDGHMDTPTHKDTHAGGPPVAKFSTSEKMTPLHCGSKQFPLMGQE